MRTFHSNKRRLGRLALGFHLLLVRRGLGIFQDSALVKILSKDHDALAVPKNIDHPTSNPRVNDGYRGAFRKHNHSRVAVLIADSKRLRAQPITSWHRASAPHNREIS